MNEFTNKPNKQHVGFERAVEARKAMLVSPSARNRQKVFEALRWLHGWGQSTSSILKLACRSTSGDFIARMRSNGLIRVERVLGTTFLLLTKSGVDLLRSMSAPDDALASLSGTRIVNLYAYHHNFYAQRLLAERMRKGPSDARWFCERQIRALVDATEPGAKCPDALYTSSLERVFFEVERTKKKQPALEVMLLNTSRMLEQRPGYVCEIYIEAGISDRYKSTIGGWLSRQEFRAWSIGTDGEYFVNGIYKATDSLLAAMRRIKFIETKVKA